ncbi:MAG TPA: alpha/beta fold hydrolase [Methanotrichaceae archaeon]|nr:alpha/beta fold hydrolase [Methanotrichaceae archaeon]
MDDTRISSKIFYPRRSQPVKAAPDRSALAFEVDEGIALTGVMHLSNESAPNILLFHGNGEVAVDYDDIGPLFTGLGINLSVLDYRGYGSSGGRPSYSRMLSDATMLFPEFKDLLKERGLNGRIFIMGRSLGSAPALELASREDVSGLIIESGFAHTYDLMIRLGVDHALLDISKEGLVSNLSKIERTTCPLLIIHGEMDEIIPLSDAVDLYNNAKSRTKELVIIPRAGHNTLLFYGQDKYMSAIERFISRG